MTKKQYDDKTLKKLHKVLTEMLKDLIYVCNKYKIDYFAIDGTGLGAVRHNGFIPWDDDVDIRMMYNDIDKFIKYTLKEFGDKYYFVDYKNTKNNPNTFPKMCLKDTTFIDETASQLNINFGIFIDIFPMYYIPDDPKKAKKILKKGYLYKTIGILSLVRKPVVETSKIKKVIILTICFIGHYILKLFRVKSEKMFDKGVKLMCNCKKSSYIASLGENNSHTKYRVKDIFPTKKHSFENIKINIPVDYDKVLTEQFGDYMVLPPIEKRHNHYPKKLEFKKK